MTDTERLDWLQNTNSARVNIDFKETSLEWWARNDREYHKMCCLTLREAIDAAMNAAGKVRRNTNEDKASTDKTLQHRTHSRLCAHSLCGRNHRHAPVAARARQR